MNGSVAAVVLLDVCVRISFPIASIPLHPTARNAFLVQQLRPARKFELPAANRCECDRARSSPHPHHLHDYVYFFFLSPPLVFATPLDSLARFFLCLPVSHAHQRHCYHTKTTGCLQQAISYVQGILTLLPACLLDLRRLSVSHQSVVWLKLLHRLR